MNFDGIFDKYNYPTLDDDDKEFMRFTASLPKLSKSQVEEAKAWIYNEPQFMDHVVKGMKNFLKSPFYIES